MPWYDPEAPSVLAARQLAEEARQQRHEGARRRPGGGRSGRRVRRPAPLPPARSAPARGPLVGT